MSAPPYDLKQAWRGFRAAWQSFFWEPVDPRPAAWIRIGFAAMVLINLACWYPDLSTWFGPAGILPLDAAQFLQAEDRWSLFAWLVPSDSTMRVMYWIFTVQAVCLLLGLASRLNLLCVLIWLSAFQNRNPMILDAEDVILRLLGWYLLLMPLSHTWSLDALIWRKLGRGYAALASPLGLRLLQIQMCLIFLTAAYYKLPGGAWQSGTALYYVSRLDDYFGRFPVPLWILENPWLVRSITWSVLVIEIGAPLIIWFKQTRWPALVLILAFHLGNEYTMNLFLFHWAMIVGWSSFVLPSDWAWLRRQRLSKQPQALAA